MDQARLLFLWEFILPIWEALQCMGFIFRLAPDHQIHLAFNSLAFPPFLFTLGCIIGSAKNVRNSVGIAYPATVR